MAGILSNEFKFQIMSGNIDFDADTFKCILMASGFAFDRDAHENYDDVSGNELAAGNGYTAGGQTLTGVSVTKSDPNDQAKVTWDTAVWTPSGGAIGPAEGLIIYKDTGSAATSTVVGHIAFPSDQTAGVGGTFAVSNVNIQGN